MDYKKINEILSDLTEYGLKNKFNQIQSHTPRDYWSEKSENESSAKVEVYEFDKEANIYLRVQRETDSYGDNESLVSLTFVNAVQTTVTAYEPVNN